jgi:two-component system, cell cycle sensor histidine kinase and response regulator CckA
METILLVDDEPDILALAHEMLEGEGYEILDALNAEEAVRVAAAHAGPVHLLLTTS